LYEPFNPKIYEKWMGIAWTLAKRGLRPSNVFKPIMKGIIEEAGCKIASRNYRPILTKPEDLPPAHEKHGRKRDGC